jgi:hypothetical protein
MRRFWTIGVSYEKLNVFAQVLRGRRMPQGERLVFSGDKPRDLEFVVHRFEIHLSDDRAGTLRLL